MLVAKDLEVRAGARLLLEHASFQVAAGDKIGLVGRNGAGKTTLTKILSGEAQPAAGTVSRTGEPSATCRRTRGPVTWRSLAKDRILSARGLDSVVERLRKAELAMGDGSAEVRDQAMAAYARAEAELAAAGGYAAEAEAARIASSLGLPERVLHQPIGTLSGGQRRRVELARILFSGAPTTAAGRADQPPGRRLDRLAARLPGRPRRWPAGDQPRRRAAGADGQQGLPPRRQPGRAGRLRDGLAALPAAARDRREAAPARAAERRAQGRAADHPGRQDAGQGHQGHRGPEHGPAGRAAAGRRRGRAGPGPGGQDQVPGAGRRAGRLR